MTFRFISESVQTSERIEGCDSRWPCMGGALHWKTFCSVQDVFLLSCFLFCLWKKCLNSVSAKLRSFLAVLAYVHHPQRLYLLRVLLGGPPCRHEDAALHREAKSLNIFSDVSFLNSFGLEIPDSWMGMWSFCQVLTFISVVEFTISFEFFSAHWGHFGLVSMSSCLTWTRLATSD